MSIHLVTVRACVCVFESIMCARKKVVCVCVGGGEGGMKESICVCDRDGMVCVCVCVRERDCVYCVSMTCSAGCLITPTVCV